MGVSCVSHVVGAALNIDVIVGGKSAYSQQPAGYTFQCPTLRGCWSPWVKCSPMNCRPLVWQEFKYLSSDTYFFQQTTYTSMVINSSLASWPETCFSLQVEYVRCSLWFPVGRGA